MADSNTDDEQRYEHLNALGWAAWLGGRAVRLTARGINHSMREVARITADTERAYQQGRDEGMDEAEIIDEWEK